jgi:hypothetical protein
MIEHSENSIQLTTVPYRIILAALNLIYVIIRIGPTFHQPSIANDQLKERLVRIPIISIHPQYDSLQLLELSVFSRIDLTWVKLNITQDASIEDT